MRRILQLTWIAFLVAPGLAWADPIKSRVIQDTQTEQYMGNGSQFIYFDVNNDITPSEALRLTEPVSLRPSLSKHHPDIPIPSVGCTSA